MPTPSHGRSRAARAARFIGTVASALLLVPAFAACTAEEPRPAAQGGAGRFIASVFSRRPDQLPTVQNREAPFRYPATLYPQKVQGNVTLRLYVDSSGAVVQDSTRVEESSGHIALDSAALLGARDLSFTPAKRRGSAVAVSLLYPVHFRHPEAAPLPGDTLLTKP